MPDSTALPQLLVRFIIASIVVLTSVSLPASVHANILLTELHPAPTDGAEWIELYNAGDAPIDLDQWTLQDMLSTPSHIGTLEGTLASGAFQVVKLSSAVLNNSGDGVSLLDDSGVVRDQFSYQDSSPGMSWSRTALDASAAWEETAPSPNAPSPDTPPASPPPSSAPSPSPSPSPDPSPSPSPPLLSADDFLPLQLSPCPSDGDEFVRFRYDGASTAETTLTLTDASENERSQTHTLQPEQTFTISSATALLNNGGDEITLTDARGTLLHQSETPSCSDGTIFIWRDGAWQKEGATPIPQADTPDTDSPDTPSSNTPTGAVSTDVNTETGVDGDTATAASVVPQSYLRRLSLNTAAVTTASTTAETASNTATLTTDEDQHPSPHLQTLAHTRRGVSSVILGGTTLLLSSSYGLYVWTETTLSPALHELAAAALQT